MKSIPIVISVHYPIGTVRIGTIELNDDVGKRMAEVAMGTNTGFILTPTVRVSDNSEKRIVAFCIENQSFEAKEEVRSVRPWLSCQWFTADNMDKLHLIDTTEDSYEIGKTALCGVEASGDWHLGGNHLKKCKICLRVFEKLKQKKEE